MRREDAMDAAAATRRIHKNIADLMTLGSTGRLSSANAKTTREQIERDMAILNTFTTRLREMTP